MNTLIPILSILIWPLAIALFVCWILVVVKAFKNEESPLMGILALVLCTLGGLIVGWINAGKWNGKKLMGWYTLLFILVLALYAVVAVVLGAAAVQGAPEFIPSQP